MTDGGFSLENFYFFELHDVKVNCSEQEFLCHVDMEGSCCMSRLEGEESLKNISSIRLTLTKTDKTFCNS